MTAKKSPPRSKQAKQASRSKKSRQVSSPTELQAQPATMVPASESAWSKSRTMAQLQSASSSRRRMIDARADMLQAERQYINMTTSAEMSMRREAEDIERKAAQIQSEAWAIEQESQTRLTVLQAQARMENELAKRIIDIAERSALSILDRIKEASDSMMDWAGLMGKDMSDMMKEEAAQQVSRKVSDIEAVEEAMQDEERALELLELTSRYNNERAA